VSKENQKAIQPGDQRVVPDPLCVVLSALTALGTIASIAAINWAAEDREVEKLRGKRKANMALRDLESCCLGLQEIFRRFHRHPRMFAGEGGNAASPMKFGVHGPRVDAESVKAFQQLTNDIASMQVLASHNSFEAMSAIEDGEISAPEELFYSFGEQQERLNELFAKRTPMKACVETGLSVAVRLTELVRELKKSRVD
jgi:hypothetical protein